MSSLHALCTLLRRMLSEGPIERSILLQLVEKERNYFVIVAHHVVCDGGVVHDRRDLVRVHLTLKVDRRTKTGEPDL